MHCNVPFDTLAAALFPVLASAAHQAGAWQAGLGMSSSAGAVADRTARLSGQGIIREIKASGIEFVISVPDITTSEGLLRPLAPRVRPRLIRVCKEDEGVGICAGLAYTGKRALLLIQQTGMLDSINAIRGVAVEYSLPVCMMVGLLGKEPGVPPRQSQRYGVRIVEPILDAMGIAYHEIEQDSDIVKIRPAIDDAYAQNRPVALLIGGRPS
jgi:sulfopyruvate decarboxylase subunit alpha